MKAKAVVPREQANRDVDEAIAYYLKEGGEPRDIAVWLQEPDGH